jgi:hypothetical protein
VENYYGPGPSYDDFVSIEARLECKMIEIFNMYNSPTAEFLECVICTASKLRRSAYLNALRVRLEDVREGRCDGALETLLGEWTDEHHFHVVKWLMQDCLDITAPNSEYNKIQRALADAYEVSIGGISEADIALATMIESETSGLSASFV